VVAICQQWLMTYLGGSAEEKTHDDIARLNDADQNHSRASGT
jgi:ferric-dicitrate binding protein FerR (iron transport regulator)